MISDFREGGRFSKIGESLCKKAFNIGEQSEIGGRGVNYDPKKSDIIYGWPLTCLSFSGSRKQRENMLTCAAFSWSTDLASMACDKNLLTRLAG